MRIERKTERKTDREREREERVNGRQRETKQK